MTEAETGKKTQKAPSDTNLGKVRQAFENNGFSLTSEISKIKSKAQNKSKELKEIIIRNPADYGVDANQLSNTFANFHDRYASINKFFLTAEDCQQAKRAIIENIKQNKQEWKIVKRWIMGGRIKLLVHKKTGNYHYEKGFTKQEWQELEKTVGRSFSSLIWIILVVVVILLASLFLLWRTKKKKNSKLP